MEFSQSLLISFHSGTITQVWSLVKLICSEHFVFFLLLTEPEKWTDEELGIPPDDE